MNIFLLKKIISYTNYQTIRKIITNSYDSITYRILISISEHYPIFLRIALSYQIILKKTRFSYKSLLNITKEYHNNVCNEYECIDYTKSTKRNIYIEPNISLINSWMGLKTSNDLSGNSKLAIGINFRFKPIKVFQLWNFLVGINYSTNHFNGDFENHLFYPTSRTYRIETKYSIIRIPIILEYSFPAKKIQPFLSSGI